MSYLGDLLGLLNYQQGQDFGLGQIQLGREELGERSRQFDVSARQWEQQENLRRQMEQFRQQQLREQMEREQGQQNYLNFNRDHDAALSYFANKNKDLLKFINPGLIGSDQANALYKKFGLPTLGGTP